ncbi:hypothetical protein G9A89_021790 [Geosiphon pyriformis]|nr:hypothetical protein G9A89_021790 [Geosiphon pyriformis]
MKLPQGELLPVKSNRSSSILHCKQSLRLMQEVQTLTELPSAKGRLYLMVEVDLVRVVRIVLCRCLLLLNAFINCLLGIVTAVKIMPFNSLCRALVVNSPKPYRENVTLTNFSPERRTVVIFEDLCSEPKKTKKLSLTSLSERHSNISSIYMTQSFSLAVYKKKMARVTPLIQSINKNLQGRDFIVIDLTKTKEDPIYIRKGWDMPAELDEYAQDFGRKVFTMITDE